MSTLHHIFSSVAKIKVLRTLMCQSKPMALRQVAAVSELPVFSVQRALWQMRDEGWVKKRKSKNRLLFSLNSAHEDYLFLRDVLSLENQHRLLTRALCYADKAKASLDFANSAHDFFASKAKHI